MVEFKNVTKAYDSTVALNDVNLRVDKARVRVCGRSFRCRKKHDAETDFTGGGRHFGRVMSRDRRRKAQTRSDPFFSQGSGIVFQDFR
jgi:ABC-type ATPase involved in cell division